MLVSQFCLLAKIKFNSNKIFKSYKTEGLFCLHNFKIVSLNKIDGGLNFLQGWMFNLFFVGMGNKTNFEMYYVRVVMIK